MTEVTSHSVIDERPMKPAMWRGFQRKCPNCGEHHLFDGYLKVADECPSCTETLSHHRADDGPAWLTILIVGHLVAPVLIEIIRNPERPLWVRLIAIPLLAGALSIALLQPVKGLWMGIIWANRVPTS